MKHKLHLRGWYGLFGEEVGSNLQFDGTGFWITGDWLGGGIRRWLKGDQKLTINPNTTYGIFPDDIVNLTNAVLHDGGDILPLIDCLLENAPTEFVYHLERFLAAENVNANT